MEMKRLICALAAALLVLAALGSASAAPNDIMQFGRIFVTMPEITVELKGTGYELDDTTATLGGEKLTVNEVIPYDKESVTTCAYVIVDLSASMSASFETVKSNITTFINSLGKNDRAVLITFGETKVETVLDGSETREAAAAAVRELDCTEQGTLFYEALSKAYQLSDTATAHSDREYAIVFSDGVDVQRGNTTYDEAVSQYSSHVLPLYAACSESTSKESTDKFGEIARQSGGSFSMIRTPQDFEEFTKTINNVTLVRLTASTNFADGNSRQLSLRSGASQTEYSVPISRSIADDEAPTVKEIRFDETEKAIVISFSEQVVGANVATAYKITDADGERIDVSAVFYSEANDEYEIKTAEALRSGDYTVEFSGITDASKEANAVAGKSTFTANNPAADAAAAAETEDGATVVTAPEETGLPVWLIVVIIIAVIVIAGLIVLVVVLITKRKPATTQAPPPEYVPPRPQTAPAAPAAPAAPGVNEYAAPQAEQEKYHVAVDTSARVRLRIKTGRTTEQNIETSITSSLMVGRSDVCDVYLDDTKLSRQHFVIEKDGDDFYIMDLQSTNGTMLNGIRINSRQPLKSNDKITAGLTDFVFSVIDG